MNKPRLIDANTLLDKLPYPTDYAESEFYGKVLDVIEELPTAYDVQGIVEQLEKELYYEMEPMQIAFDQGIRTAIEIVKGGVE